MIPDSITLLLLLLCSGALMLASLTSTRTFLFLFGFFIPLLYPNLNIGVNVFCYQVVIVLALVMNAPRLAQPQLRAKGLTLFCLYAIALTVAWYAVDQFFLFRYKSLESLALGAGQTVWKMPVQLASLLIAVFAFYLPQLRARTIADVARLERGIQVGVGLSTLAGIFMAVRTGVGFIADSATGVIEVAGTRVARIGGLSGEPKMLGAILAVVEVGLLAGVLFGDAPKGRGQFIILSMLFGLGLVATWSTSAWIGFFAGAVFLFLPIPLARSRRGRIRRLATVATLLVIGGALLEIIPVRRAIDDRLVRRVTGANSELGEQKDGLVLDVFRLEPQWLITGFGAGGFDLESAPIYISDPKYAKNLQYVRTPTPAANGPRLLGDMGLIGIFLIAVPAYRIALKCIRRGMLLEGKAILAGGVATLFVSFSAFPVYFVLLGCAVAKLGLSESDAAQPALCALRRSALRTVGQHGLVCRFPGEG